MGNVNIKFNGKEFLLSCEDGQEEHLEELSFKLNDKFNELKKKLGNIGENKLLLITSITTIDEYYEIKKKIQSQTEEIENIKSRFKELKALVYEYKDNKETHINKLDEKQKKLEEEINNNSNDYNKLLENTTNQIEDFIKKNSSDKQTT
tara:strand:- start:841 stop:1287 length:447 start_codon:yes stop_codon:yes gene_type:complete